MIEKTATVHWEGQGKKGVGKISTQTGAFNSYPYGFASRFEDDRRGTNPEEILGAAHAACFTMAFSFACDKAGFATAAVDTQARVRLSPAGDGFVIDRDRPRDEGVHSGDRRGRVPEDRRGCEAQLPRVQGAGRRRRHHAVGDAGPVAP